MSRNHGLLAAIPAALMLAGCVATVPAQQAQQRPTVIIAPQPRIAVATLAPSAPPPAPPQAALVPPPPRESGVVWQPGFWTYTGASDQPWTWVDGRYVTPPSATQAAWTPGQWRENASGHWAWTPGHWQ